LTVVIAVVSVVLVYFLFDIFFVILKRFSTQGMQDTGRVENIVQGVIALADSGGLGIGIGNYGPIMGEVYGVRYAAPHNVFLEVLVCFGLVVFLIFLGMIYRLFKFARASEHSNRVLWLFSMIALLFAGIVDSNYLMKVPTWAFLATTYIYVDKRYNRQQKIEK
jgi:O-antigen ligase